jgi:hypothetical protein
MTRHHAQPQHVHIMPSRSRTNRLCGATTGGFVRLNSEGKKWLQKFLARGGSLCTRCAKLSKEEV